MKGQNFQKLYIDNCAIYEAFQNATYLDENLNV